MSIDRRGLPLLLLLALAAAAPACGGAGESREIDGGPGGGDDDGGDDDRADASPEADCAAERFVARFVLSPDSLQAFYAANLTGRWLDRPEPELLGVLAEEGDCTWVGFDGALCDPACDGSTEVCDRHGVCVPYARGIDVGGAHVSGSTPALDVEPTPDDFFGASYNGGDHADFFAAGDPLSLSFDGGEGVAAAELATVGVAPLVAPDEATATEHQPMTITWTPVATPADAEVVVVMTENHHGGTDHVECRAAASAGSLTVPVAILDPLIAASGLFGIESSSIAVRRRATAPLPSGCLAVDAQDTRSLSVTTIRAR